MAGPASPPTPPASETPPKTAPATEFSVAVLLMVAKGLALKVIPVKTTPDRPAKRPPTA